MVISACRGLFALYIGEFGLLFYFLFALVISILLTYFFVSLVRIYETKMKRGLFFGYKDAVFQDIDSPIIAFNKRDKIFFVNNSARKFIADLYGGWKDEYEKNIMLQDFISKINDDYKADTFDGDCYFKWSYSTGGMQAEKNVTYRIVRDMNEKIMCKYFMFSDSQEDVDSVTGFRIWETFKHHMQMSDISFPAGVIAFDLNRLSIINDKYGKQEGDKLLALVASAMVKKCPKKTFFAKSYSSCLIAICCDTDVRVLETIKEEIKHFVYDNVQLPEPIHIQSSVVELGLMSQNLANAVDMAIKVLKKKNMLDDKAKHSSLIDSFIKMQLTAVPDLMAHVHRTKILCHMLGKRLELTDIQQSDLELLCLIHDIGKTGVPPSILHKAGKYTVQEWDIMKSHVYKGHDIAIASEEFEDVAQCIKYHHENYDGTGYPEGLKGESIPLLSRIIAVVDAYDAMINDRPYRKAYSITKARQELKAYAGLQFDPHIVDEFVKMLEEIAPSDYEEDEEGNRLSSGFRPMGTMGEVEEDRHVNNVLYSNYVIDGEQNIISVDNVFTQITGYTPDDVKVLKLKQDDLIFDEDKKLYNEKVAELLSKFNEVYLKHRMRCKDGSERIVFCYGRFKFTPDSDKITSKITITDITDSELAGKVNKNEDYKLQINEFERDGLTGVLTFKSFDKTAKNIVQTSLKDYLICHVDIDDFYDYNKNHDKGDVQDILKNLAQCINKISGKDSLVGRVGEDRFVVLYELEPGHDNANSKAIVSELWGAIMDYLGANDSSLTVSVGAYKLISGQDSLDQAYEKSLEALLKSKENGKNCYHLI